MKYTLKTFSEAIADFGGFSIEKVRNKIESVDYLFLRESAYTNSYSFIICERVSIIQATPNDEMWYYNYDINDDFFVFCEEDQTVMIYHTTYDGDVIPLDIPAETGVELIAKIVQKIVDKKI